MGTFSPFYSLHFSLIPLLLLTKRIDIHVAATWDSWDTGTFCSRLQYVFVLDPGPEDVPFQDYPEGFEIIH